MSEEELNLTEEERNELRTAVFEDENPEEKGLELAPDEEMDKPSDMPVGEVEDDSGSLVRVIEDDNPVLNEEDGTPVHVGSLG